MVPPPPPPPARGSFAWLSTLFGRQVMLILGMALLLMTVSKCSRDFADRKALEWLNKYNNVEAKRAASWDSPCEITTNSEATTTPTPTPSPVGGNVNAQSSTGANANANTNRAPGDDTNATDNTNTTVNANVNAGANTNARIPGGTKNRGAPESPREAAQPTPTPPLTPDVEKRLNGQLKGIQARICHHGAVMAFFYKAYYMSIAVVMFAGMIAAIALFFIAQVGWSDTNPYVKAVFVVMTAAAAYYGLFPPVFQQQQNISDNKALFLAYKTLENEVVSYPLTRKNIKGEAKEPGDFVNYIDSEMNRLGNIAIGFDYTKITYKGAFDLSERQGQPTSGNVNANANNNAGRGNQNRNQ